MKKRYFHDTTSWDLPKKNVETHTKTTTEDKYLDSTNRRNK
jgi:hypothetical protein